jgi:hypothetical protein
MRGLKKYESDLIQFGERLGAFDVHLKDFGVQLEVFGADLEGFDARIKALGVALEDLRGQSEVSDIELLGLDSPRPCF